MAGQTDTPPHLMHVFYACLTVTDESSQLGKKKEEERMGVTEILSRKKGVIVGDDVLKVGLLWHLEFTANI